MAQTTYYYNKTSLDWRLLRASIYANATITKTLVRIDYPNPGLSITFSDALSAGEKTALDTEVSNHTGPTVDSLGKKEAGDFYFFDDFAGQSLGSPWNLVVSGNGSTGGVVYPVEGGQFAIRAGNASGRYSLLTWATATPTLIPGLVPTQNIAMTARFKLVQTTSCIGTVGLGDTATWTPTNYLRFYYDSSASANWYTATYNGSGPTTTDTTVAADTNWHSITIATDHADDSVKFYLDSTLVATHTTNVSMTTIYAPRFGIYSLTSATKDLYIDSVLLKQWRV